MEEQELEETRECVDCGELIISDSPHFEISAEEEIVLCYSCALRRGGVFDSARDEWVKLPDLTAVPLTELERHENL